MSVDSRRPAGRFDQTPYLIGQTLSGDNVETIVPLLGFVRGVVMERSHTRLGTLHKGYRFAVAGTLVGHSESVRVDILPSEVFDVVDIDIAAPDDSLMRAFCIGLVLKEPDRARMIHGEVKLKVTTLATTYEASTLVTGQLLGPVRLSPSAIVLSMHSGSVSKRQSSLVVTIFGEQGSIEDLRVKFSEEFLRVALEEKQCTEVRYRVSTNPSSALKPCVSAIDVLDGDRLIGSVPVVIVP